MTLSTAPVSGQQPKRKLEPYVAPLLPAETAWLATLPTPTAGGAMDRYTVFVPVAAGDPAAPLAGTAASLVQPLTPSIVALERETGRLRWTAPLATTVPPIVVNGMLLVAAGTELHALDTATGTPLWTVPLDGAVQGRMVSHGQLVVAFAEPDRLIAVDTGARAIAWMRSVGSGPVHMVTDATGVYLTAPNSRAMKVSLTDGATAWERTLAGTLNEPAVGEDRVLIGSDANALWALDPESGRGKWTWIRRIFGADVVGSAVEDDRVFVASLDNIIRALDRGSGSQEWKVDVRTRPQMPPRAFFGTVVVIGLDPTVSTFLARTGEASGTWSAPENAELEGPPLIDEHLQAFSVAMVVVLRDGRVIATRPRRMKLEEPSAARLTTLPGRPLPLEVRPGATPPPEAIVPISPLR